MEGAYSPAARRDHRVLPLQSDTETVLGSFECSGGDVLEKAANNAGRPDRQMLVETRDRIQKLKAGVKTEDEIVAAKPNADYDAKFGVDARAIGNVHTSGLLAEN
jgi:hypothetical protein